jgi:uncharacterized membrane protein YfhO
VLSVSASRAGVVVLSDLHAPGWEARVNGERVPILRADYLFRAVPVAAGESEIRFSYRPASFRRGLAVSVGAALAIALLLAAEARHRRRPG